MSLIISFMLSKPIPVIIIPDSMPLSILSNPSESSGLNITSLFVINNSAFFLQASSGPGLLSIAITFLLKPRFAIVIEE